MATFQMSRVKVEMSQEMVDFRKLLDEAAIDWEDRSDVNPWCTIYRTHFWSRGNKYSVIHGYGSYGGVDPFTQYDEGMLELMSSAVNDGYPVGYLTARKAYELVQESIIGEPGEWYSDESRVDC